MDNLTLTEYIERVAEEGYGSHHLTNLCKWMVERRAGIFAMGPILLRAKTDRMLWRIMIGHFLKRHGR